MDDAGLDKITPIREEMRSGLSSVAVFLSCLTFPELSARTFVLLFVQARNYISSLPQMPKRNFADVFIGANPQGKTRNDGAE